MKRDAILPHTTRGQQTTGSLRNVISHLGFIYYISDVFSQMFIVM